MQEYQHASIKKRDGSLRTILIPNEELLERQHSLLPELIHLPIHPAACAYVKGGSVEKYAAPHHYHPTILAFDVEDFFPSISAKQLYQALFPHFPKWKVNQIIDTCTYQGKLPQGAATSPVLSNIACYRLDKQLTQYALAKEGVYTRYADDICFSFEGELTEFGMEEVINEVCFVLYLNQFKVNQAKTKVNPTHLAGVLVWQSPLISEAETRLTNASSS